LNIPNPSAGTKTVSQAAPGGQPLVTIVTPSFNQAPFLEATLQSVLAQTYPNIEYIVVDGGSTDGSREIIERYSDRLTSWVSEADQGQADAINKGFALARGDILAWINSDDTLLPHAVENAVQILKAHQELGMIYGHAYYVDENSNRMADYPSAPTDYVGLRRGVNTIPQQASFFRSKVWQMVGPLDPSFFYAMDYDLWVRISAVTPIAYFPVPMANFRIHDASKSRTAASRCWPEMKRIHFRDGGSTFSIFYAKYLVRRVVEPLMPLRLEWRKWRFARQAKNAHQGALGDPSS
jgi:glycosyltransferase involved in cell wall biosynthesis